MWYKIHMECSNNQFCQADCLQCKYNDFSTVNTDMLPVFYLVFDEAGIIIRCNVYMLQKLGYSKEEITGKNYFELFFPEHERDCVQQFSNNLRQSGEMLVKKSEIYAKNSEKFTVRWHGRFINSEKPFFLWIGSNVTETEHAQELLAASMVRYKTTFETTGCATVLLDNDRKILMMNKNFSEIFGFIKEQAEGKILLDMILTDCDRDRMIAYHEQRRRNPESAPNYYTALLKDSEGRNRHFLVNVNVVPGTANSVFSAFDITVMKKQERMLKKKIRIEKGLSFAVKHALLSQNLKKFFRAFPRLLKQYFGCNYLSMIRFVGPDSPPKQIFRWYEDEKNSGKQFPSLPKEDFGYIWDFIRTVKEYQILPVDETVPEPVRKVFRDINVFSMVVLPVYENQRYCGHIFMGTSRKTTDWIKKNLTIIKTASFIIGSFVQKQRYLKRLRKKHRLNRLILDAMSDGFCLLASDGTIIESNPAFSQITGYSQKELIGKKITDFEKSDEKKEHFNILESGVRYETEFVNKSKNTVWVEISFSFSAPENATYISAFFRDITHKKQLEQSQKIQSEELAHASKMAAVGTLVAGVAHEINNPNNYIILNSRLIKKLMTQLFKQFDSNLPESDEALHQFNEYRQDIFDLLDGIQDGGQHIDEIVKGLKHFSSKDIESIIEPFSINDSVQEAIRLLKGQIHKSTGNFALNLAQTVPLTIGSMRKIQQVVVNLLQNACLAITDRNKSISVATEYDPNTDDIILRVADEGTGIIDENLKRITEPFFTTRRTEGGTGLGLSISHTIVREHDGVIKFYSEQEKGTTVEVRIPVKR